MLALIALILFGVGVIAVAAVLLRSAPAIKARKARDFDPELAESEVYKKLYGKRSLTVSAPVPAEAPAKADAESAQTQRAMSQENVELVRRATDAFAAEDVEGLVGCADPAIEFEPHLAGVEGNYSGREGIREFMADAFETLEMRGMDYAEIRDLGDRVMALGTFHIHGRESGIEDDIPFALVVRIRAGLILHLKDYGNRVLALEAVGLSE